MKIGWSTGYILGLAVVVSLLFWFASKLGMVLFIAILMALLLKPLKEKLERRLSPGISSLISIILFWGIAILFLEWLLHTIMPNFRVFAHNIPHMMDPKVINDYMVILNLSPEIIEYVNHVLGNATEFAVAALKGSLVPTLHALSGIVELIGVPFLAFYFLKDGHKLRDMAISFVPEEERTNLKRFYDSAASVLSGYIRGQISVCMLSALAVFIYFIVMGLPYAPAFAAVTAVGEFIPVIGPLAASCLAIIVASAFTASTMIKMAIFYAVMFKINHNIIYPKLVGSAINLHPVVIMVGLLLFSHLFGVVGMMLAVPAMGLIRILLLNTIPEYKKILKLKG